MELTPDFKIEVNNKDVTKTIKKHLTSLTFKDESSNLADELTLNFDSSFKRPNYKDEIKLYLGYKESGLFYCGNFLVQSSTISNNFLSVKATGTNFLTNLKNKRNRSFENVNLCEVVSKIANENFLNFKCNFKEVFIKHLAQTNESDLSFLNRLAKEYNATFNIKNNTIIFIKKELNEDLPVFEIKKDEVLSYSITFANKTIYKSIKAKYHNTKENKIQKITFGQGSPIYTIEDVFKNKEEALQRAKIILSYLNQNAINGNITLKGKNIIAGAKIKLSGFDEESNKEFLIKSVTHLLNSSGYVIKIEF